MPKRRRGSSSNQMRVNRSSSVPVCHIDSLPDHLLVKIFASVAKSPDSPSRQSPFPERILLNRVGLVSRRWNRLVFSPQLWRHFHRNFFRPGRCSPEFLSFFHRIAPAIEDLRVQIGADDFAKFPSFPNVTRLWVDTYSTPTDAELIVKFCPNVTSATIVASDVRKGCLKLFASGWKQLVEVRISGDQLMTAAELIEFINAIANPLQSIVISEMLTLTDRDFDDITKVLGTALKSINIGYDEEMLTGWAIQSISRNCPQLEEICIERPINIGYVKDLTNLRKLTLIPVSYPNIVIEGYVDCFCRPFAHLRYLKIEEVKTLSDSILKLIANSCPSLETFILSIQGNQAVTDAGLSEIINKCRCLTSLTLSGFPLLTGRSFIGAREKLPRLRVVNFLQSQNLDVNVLKTEFAGVKVLKIYRDKVAIHNG